MTKRKGIGNRLNPKDNSNTFWHKREIPFNRISLTRVNDIIII